MIEEEIAKFDWLRIQSFAGSSDSLPDDLCGLVSARDALDAERFHDRIELTVLMDGTLSEACVAVAACLVSSLADMSPIGRAAALDLLAQIGSAGVYGPEVEWAGPIDAEACRRIVAQGFDIYATELQNSLSYKNKINCIDLVTLSGRADQSLNASAIVSLESARRNPDLIYAIRLIDASLSDLKFDR